MSLYKFFSIYFQNQMFLVFSIFVNSRQAASDLLFKIQLSILKTYMILINKSTFLDSNIFSKLNYTIADKTMFFQ